MVQKTRRQIFRASLEPDDHRHSTTIASLIVQARPERLDSVSQQVGAIDGIDIHGRDERGKLVIVLECPSDSELSAVMSQISSLKGVLGVSLVFHHPEFAA